MSKFYITNAIPYVNAKPHIGHALEFIQSDVIARYHKILGDDVLLLCGGDENALKNVQAAEKASIPVQEFVDKHSKLFFDLSKKLHIQFDIWQKGSDKTHHTSSQKLWELCEKAGDIYKKRYKGLYCVGCEQFYTQDELDESGECYEHPGKKLEEIEEANYFFKLSKYQDQMIQIIELGELEIVPTFRKNEVLTFLKHGLEDISISRSNERAKNWGVPVPHDDSQRMYVWFDALNIYQSGIGFGSSEQNKEEMYKKWWPADVHVIGKGIVRFHAVYWPAFLLSAGLKLPKKLFVHEYFTVNGQKMSKTLGNVIDPLEMIEKYGTDALRYYCLAKFSPFSDGDFSEEKLKDTYNADLANGLGNLVARVAKLCENADFTHIIPARFAGESRRAQAGIQNKKTGSPIKLGMTSDYGKALSEYRFNDVLFFVWKKISELDKLINDEKPWVLQKTNDSKLKTVLDHAVDQIQEIAAFLEPFLPETAEKIEEQFKGPKIISQKPLFPRIT